MPVIAVLTDPAKGGTFLTWTLHWLAGHTRYYHAQTDQVVDLPADPSTNRNAHLFSPNQPISLDHYRDCAKKLKNRNDQTFHIIYFHNFIEHPYSDQSQTTKQAIDELQGWVDRIIVLTNHQQHLLYDKTLKSRSPNVSFTTPGKFHDNEDQFDEFLKYFFGNSLEQWKQAGLNDVWDYREFLALNYRHHSLTIENLIDLSKDHFAIDCMEWFNLADKMIEPLCLYLGIDIDSNRLHMWLPIYHRWRQFHYQRLNFLWNFKKIIEYILKGYHMDLERFNLDVYQEAIIQHEMIYRYGLNFKTFQLTKFQHTAQLHQLLEPNLHPLSIDNITGINKNLITTPSS